MASKLAKVKEIILELLSDENEYTTDDIQKQILNCGLELDSKSSVIRTAIYQLRSSGIDIYSRDRGIYQPEVQPTPRRHDCGRRAIIQRSRRLELPFSVNSGGGGVAFFSLLYSRGVVPVLERK